MFCVVHFIKPSFIDGCFDAVLQRQNLSSQANKTTALHSSILAKCIVPMKQRETAAVVPRCERRRRKTSQLELLARHRPG